MLIDWLYACIFLLLWIECVMKRLKDTDSVVRLKALTLLAEWLVNNPLSISLISMEQIVDRVKDKSYEIRKLAVESVGKAYFKHVSSTCLHSMTEIKSYDQIVQLIPNGVWERLQQVPSFIVNCWGYPEPEFKMKILRIVQENLIPKQLKLTDCGDESLPTKQLEGARAIALILLFGSLNSKEKSILGSIISYKAKIRKELKSFLELRHDLMPKAAAEKSFGKGGKGSSNAENDNSDREGLFRRCKHNLIKLLPPDTEGASGNANDYNKKCMQMVEKLCDTK